MKCKSLYWKLHPGFGQNDGNTWKFQTNFLKWFSDCSSPHEVQLCAVSFFYNFWGKWILEMVIKLYCILVILPNNLRSLSGRFSFLPKFCFSENGLPSFSNAVITFQTAILAIPNNSAVFATLAPALRAPTIWLLLKLIDLSDLLTLMNFN